MKKILYLGSILILVLVINGFAHSIYDLWAKKDVLTEARKNLENEKTENRKLKAELSYVKTQGFIEEEARNKLFLTKPGENVVIFPTASSSASQKMGAKEENWQKWLNLFL